MLVGGEVAGVSSAEQLELEAVSAAEACVRRIVAVKCICIAQNTDCEGGVPCRH